MSTRGAWLRTPALGRPARWFVVGGLLLSLVAAWLAGVLHQSQERELLRGRAVEVGALLTQAINAIPDRLAAHGIVLRATQPDASIYEQIAARDVETSQGRASFAWLRSRPDGSFVVLSARGASLRTGAVVTGERAEPMSRALASRDIVPGRVLGGSRDLGFALGPPTAPDGTVLYQENALGADVNPPRQAGTGPFAEVDVVLYGTPTPDTSQALVATTDELPLQGDVARVPLPVGPATWLLEVRAKEPLTGSLASTAPWLAFAAVLTLALALTVCAEIADRRRREALQRYATEREASELFQRSLLPHLPVLPDLDIAARYLPSQRGQEVGGDWFDVFPLSDGRVGVVIGDVMGHDLVAASGMAQVRSALRAYARREPDPAVVLNLLDDVVSEMEMAELVTVFYGVLSATDPHGGRVLRWCNAGHLPPLLLAEGTCKVLHERASLLIGTPVAVVRESSQTILSSGTTLVLFTDGLVEAPGASIDEAMEELATALSSAPSQSANELCDAALALTRGLPQARRDDIALLAVGTRALTSAMRAEPSENTSDAPQRTRAAVEPLPADTSLT